MTHRAVAHVWPAVLFCQTSDSSSVTLQLFLCIFPLKLRWDVLSFSVINLKPQFSKKWGKSPQCWQFCLWRCRIQKFPLRSYYGLLIRLLAYQWAISGKQMLSWCIKSDALHSQFGKYSNELSSEKCPLFWGFWCQQMSKAPPKKML